MTVIPSLASLALAATFLAPAALAQSTDSLTSSSAQINRLAVTLEATQGNRAAGTITLSPDNRGLRVTGTVTGLDANSEHGFHFHEHGDCSAPDASSAGDHFNPDGHAHGHPDTRQRHAGAMRNLKTDGSGRAEVDMYVDLLTLGDGGKYDVVGTALIVHADADDYTSQPVGNAGARLSCGVVERPAAVQSADEDNGNG